MPMTVGTSGGNKLVGTMTLGTSGGNKAVLLGVIGTSGGNKTFYQSLTAAASPTLVAKSGITSTLTTSTTTVTPSGGVGPYTHSWAYLSGINGPITANSPTSATTDFTATGMLSPESRVGYFRDTVTDTATGATATADVEVDIDRL